MGATPKPTAQRIATLDLLRLAAALAVLCFHYLFRGAAGEPMLDVAFPEAAGFAIYGYLGVHLFFLISGFVISWSADGRDWQGFAIARFGRIYPAFVVCMTLTFVLLLFAADARFPAGPQQFAANLVVLSPALGQPFMDGVYWSIVLEIIFYGWVALALLAGVFGRWRLPIVAGWMAACMLNEFLLGSDALRLLFITEYGPWFASGVLVFDMWKRGVSLEAALLLVGSFLLSCGMLAIGREWMQIHYGQSVALGNLIAANAMLHLLLIAAIVLRRRVPSSPLVLALGGMTYPLYLLHQNIGYVGINLASAHVGRWVAFSGVTIAMLAASWAVWRFAERPLRPLLVSALARLLSALRGAFARRGAESFP